MSEFLGEFLQYLALMACMIAGWSLTRCASQCFGRDRWPSQKKELYDTLVEEAPEDSPTSSPNSSLKLPLKSKARSSSLHLAKAQPGNICDNGEEGQDVSESLGEPEPEAETSIASGLPATTDVDVSVPAKVTKAKARKAHKHTQKQPKAEVSNSPRPTKEHKQEQEQKPSPEQSDDFPEVQNQPEEGSSIDALKGKAGSRTRPEPLALESLIFEQEEPEQQEEEKQEQTEEPVEHSLPEEVAAPPADCEAAADDVEQEAIQEAVPSPLSSSPTRYSEKYSFIKGRLWSDVDVDDEEEDWMPPLPSAATTGQMQTEAEVGVLGPQAPFVDPSSFMLVVPEPAFQLYSGDNQQIYMMPGWDMSQQAGYFENFPAMSTPDFYQSHQAFQASSGAGAVFLQPPVFHGMQDAYCEGQCQQGEERDEHEEGDSDLAWNMCWDFFPRERGLSSLP